MFEVFVCSCVLLDMGLLPPTAFSTQDWETIFGSSIKQKHEDGEEETLFLCHKSCHSLLHNCVTDQIFKQNYSRVYESVSKKIRMNDGLRCVWRLCTYRWSCECCEQSIEGAGVQQGTCATSWLANSYLSTPPPNWKLDQAVQQASLFKLMRCDFASSWPCHSDFIPLVGVQWKRILTSDW